MDLNLSATERDLLLEILEEHHRELLREIAKTKHREFRHDLRHRADLLESIVQKLEVREPAGEMARAA
jgi:hypothetical protein